MDLEKLCEAVIKIVKPIGIYIKNKRDQFEDVIIEKKGVRDFVTEVDRTSEKKLVAQLSNLFPEAGFITEEKTVVQSNKDHNWIIDPLDGTMNYLHGIPLYSISIALQYQGEIILGVVYEIVHDEMFYSWKGANAYCNEKKIQVSDCATIQDALIVTGFPYIRNEERTRKLAETIKYFLDNGRDIRRLGSAATDLCYIACGRIDIYYEGYLNIWDIAAGILIVENAGGVVSDFKGQHNFSEGQILASNKSLIKSSFIGVSLM